MSFSASLLGFPSLSPFYHPKNTNIPLPIWEYNSPSIVTDALFTL